MKSTSSVTLYSAIFPSSTFALQSFNTGPDQDTAGRGAMRDQFREGPDCAVFLCRVQVDHRVASAEGFAYSVKNAVHGIDASVGGFPRTGRDSHDSVTSTSAMQETCAGTHAYFPVERTGPSP